MQRVSDFTKTLIPKLIDTLAFTFTAKTLRNHARTFFFFATIRSTIYLIDLAIVFLISRFIFIVFSGGTLTSEIITLDSLGFAFVLDVKQTSLILFALIVLRPLITILTDKWILRFLGYLEISYTKSKVLEQLKNYSEYLSPEEQGRIVHILTYGPSTAFVRLISDQIRILTELFGLALVLIFSLVFSPVTSLLVFLFYVFVFGVLTILLGRQLNRSAEVFRSKLISSESQLLQIQAFLPELKILPVRWQLSDNLMTDRTTATRTLANIMILESAPRLLLESFSYLFLLSVGMVYFLIDGQSLMTITFTLLLIGRLVPILSNISNHLNSIRYCRPLVSLLRETFGMSFSLPEKRDINTELLAPLGNSLNIENLSYSTKESRLFQNLSLRTGENSFIAIYGSSGSGKSTLGKLCLGLLEDVSDAIKIGALSPQELNALRPGYLFLVSATPIILPGNLYINISLELSSEKTSARKVEEVASKLGLDHLLDDASDISTRSLSQGERQRVAIGRWLYSNPSFVVFDEPTSFLDGSNAKLIRELLLENSDCTRIVLTHDLEFQNIVDFSVVLEDGKLIPIK